MPPSGRHALAGSSTERQSREKVPAGGKLLTIVDLSDVGMTFFLPETVAGKVAIGSEVRLVLDAVPQYVIPAKVSFVDSTAQFTPKAVETTSERRKLMFRSKAQIDPNCSGNTGRRSRPGSLEWPTFVSKPRYPGRRICR